MSVKSDDVISGSHCICSNSGEMHLVSTMSIRCSPVSMPLLREGVFSDVILVVRVTAGSENLVENAGSFELDPNRRTTGRIALERHARTLRGDDLRGVRGVRRGGKGGEREREKGRERGRGRKNQIFISYCEIQRKGEIS